MNGIGIRSFWIFVFVATIIGISVVMFASDLRVVDLEMRAGRYDDAIVTFENMLEKDPGNARTRREYGDLLLSLQHFEEARRQLEIARALGENDEVLLQNLLKIYRLEQNKALTIAILRDMVALRPEKESYRVDIADAYAWNGQYALACLYYDSLRIKNPDNIEYLQKLVAYNTHQRRITSAIRYQSQITRLMPNKETGFIRLADLYLADGQRSRAASTYEKALKIAPKRVDIHLKLADLYDWLQLPGGAIEHLNIALKTTGLDDKHLKKFLDLSTRYAPLQTIRYYQNQLNHPHKSIRAREQLASLFVHLGHPEEALFHLHKSIEQEPENMAHRRRLAGLYTDLHKPELARKVREEAVRRGDTSRPMISALINRYRFEKKYNRLTSLLARVYQQNLADYSLRTSYADALVKTGQHDRATAVLQDLLAKKPKDHRRRLQLASIYLASNQDDEAAQVLWQGIENHQVRDQQYLHGAAELFTRRNEIRKAITCYETLVKVLPQNVINNKLLLWSYVQSRQFGKAISVYNRIHRLRPLTVDERFEVASLHHLSGDRNRMKKMLQDILVEHQKDSKVNHKMAGFYFQNGMFENALEYTRKILKKAPTDSAGLRTKALASAWSNRPSQARRELNRFHQLYAGDFETRFHLGELYHIARKRGRAAKEYAAALDHLENAIKNRDADIVRARIYGRKGDVPAMRDIFDGLLTNMPDDPYVLMQYAQALSSNGFHADADMYLSHALRLNPENYSAARLQGQIWLAAGDVRQAARAWRKLERKNGYDTGLQIDLADVDMLLGDWVSATRRLERVTNKYPENRAAKDRLFRLRSEKPLALTSGVAHENQGNRLSRTIYSLAWSFARSALLQGTLKMEQDDAQDSSNLYNRNSIKIAALELDSRLSEKARLESGMRVYQNGKGTEYGFSAGGHWQFSPGSFFRVGAILNHEWRNHVYLANFQARQSSLESTLNFTMSRLVLTSSFQLARFADAGGPDFGRLTSIGLQAGMNWSSMPSLYTYYQYHHNLYTQLAQHPAAAFLADESIHGLGMNINRQLLSGLFMKVGGSTNYEALRQQWYYAGRIDFELMFLSNFLLKSYLEYGSEGRYFGRDNSLRMSINLGYHY